MRPAACALPWMRTRSTSAVAWTSGTSRRLPGCSAPCARRRSAATSPPPSSRNHGLRTNRSLIQFSDSKCQRPSSVPDSRGNSALGASKGSVRPAMRRSASSMLRGSICPGRRARSRMSRSTSSSNASTPRSVAPTPACSGTRQLSLLPGCSSPCSRRRFASTWPSPGSVLKRVCAPAVSMRSATLRPCSCNARSAMQSLRRPGACAR